MKTILVVEDEVPKRAAITSALSSFMGEAIVLQANSVDSAIKSLKLSPPDLVILDMSLPTYDVGPGENGGRPQGFGGVEVLRYMDRLALAPPVIVVTAYDAFAKGGRQFDLAGMEEELAREHAHLVRKVVFFNSVFETWREELARAIEGVKK